MEIPALILTSTVVAAIVTGLIGYLSSRKGSMLKYITEERKNWRNEMRDIAESIEKTEPCDIENYLTKLKVRINAYGNVEFDDFHKDGHIWSLIKDLEKTQEKDDEKYACNKKLLVEYISLLLKADWERSKKEVRGSSEKILQVMLILFSVAVFAFYYFVQWERTDITEFAIHTVYLIFTALFVTFGFRFLNRPSHLHNADRKKRLGSLSISLIVYVVWIMWMSRFFFQRWEICPLEDRWVILACIYIGYALNLLELSNELKESYTYEAAVKKLWESRRNF